MSLFLFQTLHTHAHAAGDFAPAGRGPSVHQHRRKDAELEAHAAFERALDTPRRYAGHRARATIRPPVSALPEARRQQAARTPTAAQEIQEPDDAGVQDVSRGHH